MESFKAMESLVFVPRPTILPVRVTLSPSTSPPVARPLLVPKIALNVLLAQLLPSAHKVPSIPQKLPEIFPPNCALYVLPFHWFAVRSALRFAGWVLSLAPSDAVGLNEP